MVITLALRGTLASQVNQDIVDQVFLVIAAFPVLGFLAIVDSVEYQGTVVFQA